ncbi:tetratricopeptide repeat-containing sensor histidine kinase [Qipengyuania sp. DGS5-3]|uniref:tetratricopeptide repeat-containing sensor histidine kinase n=1 Tax=Qipengyuania sp. DGS5-3 TaxID=3349632 RepID=UPI0036D2FB56
MPEDDGGACRALVQSATDNTLRDDFEQFKQSRAECEAGFSDLSSEEQLTFARDYLTYQRDYLSRDALENFISNASGKARTYLQIRRLQLRLADSESIPSNAINQLRRRLRTANDPLADFNIRLAEASITAKAGNIETAISSLTELLQEDELEEYPSVATSVRLALAELQNKDQNHDAAVASLSDAAQSFDSSTPELDLKRFCLIVRRVFLFEPSREIEDAYLDDLQERFRREGMMPFALCLSLTKIILARMVGQHDQVLRQGERLLSEIEADPMAVIEFNVLHTLGQAAYAQGNSGQAIEYYQRALEILIIEETYSGQASIYNSLGNIFSDLGDNERALTVYKQSVALFEEATGPRTANAAVAHSNIGYSHAAEGRHSEALVSYAKARDIAGDYPARQILGYTDYYEARSLHALGDTDAAIEMASRAIPTALNKGNAINAAAIYAWTASLNIEQSNIRSAQENLNKVTEILARDDVDASSLDEDAAFSFWKSEYHQNMSTVLAAMGDYEAALGHSMTAVSLSNDRYEREKVRAAANADLQMDLRDKDRTIELSAKDAELQSLRLEQSTVRTYVAIAFAVLAAIAAGLAFFSYRTQQRLASLQGKVLVEEHHRTKNVLNLASSLIRLEERELNDGSGDLQGLRQRLKTMALLHEHLRNIDDHVDVEMREFVTELVNHASNALSPEGVEARVESDSFLVSPEVATPLGLIICEMMINAYKHAFRDGHGEFSVELRKGKNWADAVISDNGIGHGDAETAQKGTGVQLIEDLVDQIGATADFSQSANGTVWTITGIPFRK